MRLHSRSITRPHKTTPIFLRCGRLKNDFIALIVCKKTAGGLPETNPELSGYFVLGSFFENKPPETSPEFRCLLLLGGGSFLGNKNHRRPPETNPELLKKSEASKI